MYTARGALAAAIGLITSEAVAEKRLRPCTASMLSRPQGTSLTPSIAAPCAQLTRLLADNNAENHDRRGRNCKHAALLAPAVSLCLKPTIIDAPRLPITGSARRTLRQTSCGRRFPEGPELARRWVEERNMNSTTAQGWRRAVGATLPESFQQRRQVPATGGSAPQFAGRL